MPKISLFVIALAAFLLGACNPIANLEEAEKRIERWQSVYSDDDRDKLYAMTGKAFKEKTSREQFEDLVLVIADRLGPIESTERTNFNVSSKNGVTATKVAMTTQFAQGAGKETFTFFGHGEDMELVGWNVESPRLALTADHIRGSQKAEPAE